MLGLARAFGGRSVASADFATHDPELPITIVAREGEPLLLAIGDGRFELPLRERRRCTWCGTRRRAEDGFRAYEPAGGRRAVFCRLEHVVPWAIRGAYWEAGAEADSPTTG